MNHLERLVELGHDFHRAIEAEKRAVAVEAAAVEARITANAAAIKAQTEFYAAVAELIR